MPEPVKEPQAKPQAAAEEGEVVVLTPENFDSVVLDPTRDVFVKFYAPWCGHCQRMVQAWEQLAATEKTNEQPIVIAKLNADSHRELATRFGVRGFPTLKFFSKSDKSGDIYHNGARDLATLQQFTNTHRSV